MANWRLLISPSCAKKHIALVEPWIFVLSQSLEERLLAPNLPSKIFKPIKPGACLVPGNRRLVRFSSLCPQTLKWILSLWCRYCLRPTPTYIRAGAGSPRCSKFNTLQLTQLFKITFSVIIYCTRIVKPRGKHLWVFIEGLNVNDRVDKIYKYVISRVCCISRSYLPSVVWLV